MAWLLNDELHVSKSWTFWSHVSSLLDHSVVVVFLVRHKKKDALLLEAHLIMLKWPQMPMRLCERKYWRLSSLTNYSALSLLALLTFAPYTAKVMRPMKIFMQRAVQRWIKLFKNLIWRLRFIHQASYISIFKHFSKISTAVWMKTNMYRTVRHSAIFLCGSVIWGIYKGFISPL